MDTSSNERNIIPSISNEISKRNGKPLKKDAFTSCEDLPGVDHELKNRCEIPKEKREESDSDATTSPEDKSNLLTTDDKTNLVFLDKNLNLLHCVSFILGSILGADIFFTPQGVLLNSSGSIGITLIIWIVCGIVCLLAAACYAELATTFRKSGGEFTFLYAAFGDRPAFVQVWMALIIGRTGGMAMMSVAFSSVIGRVLYTGCGSPPDNIINLIAAVTLSKSRLLACLTHYGLC